MPVTLATLLQQAPYTSYTYAYPHKTAYRAFPQPLSLTDLWSEEQRDSLFLYMHVPFCEMRCGFCNLFTTVDHAHSFANGYLAALERQARQVKQALGRATITRMALGGGTPTFLATSDLARLFTISHDLYGIEPGTIPASVETSPMTAEREKLELLREYGTDRISIGVQSFVEAESRAAGRPQKTALVEQALNTIREIGFPILNIDLIYGLPGQTVASWLTSLQAALHFQPEELYLYPLYVRPLTGLGRLNATAPAQEDIREECYRVACDFLLDHGYTQVTMRMFRAPHAPTETGPVYCAQDDGMIGLGCGSRSYTRQYHYSDEYAVAARGVRDIIAHYIARPESSFASAHYGFHLNENEQRRRYVLKSLLEAGGLDLPGYTRRFESDVFTDLPELQELISLELASSDHDLLQLNPAGLALSDTIGPWLYSQQTQALMEGYTLR